MKDIIDLDNNYYLKVVNENNEIPFWAISIENLKLIKALKKEKNLMVFPGLCLMNNKKGMKLL